LLECLIWPFVLRFRTKAVRLLLWPSFFLSWPLFSAYVLQPIYDLPTLPLRSHSRRLGGNRAIEHGNKLSSDCVVAQHSLERHHQSGPLRPDLHPRLALGTKPYSLLQRIPLHERSYTARIGDDTVILPCRLPLLKQTAKLRELEQHPRVPLQSCISALSVGNTASNFRSSELLSSSDYWLVAPNILST
jgi:hypothetical protein